MAAPVNPTLTQFIDSAFWTTEIYNRWVAVTSGWTAYTPSWTASTTNPTLGNGTLTAAYKRWDAVSKMVSFRIRLVMGSTTGYGSGQWSFSLPAGVTPAALSPVHGHALDVSPSNARYALVGYISTTGGGTVERIASNGTLGLASTIPFTWAVGDILCLGGSFEVT